MSEHARITPYRDGPLLVRGPFRITDQDGNEVDFHHGTVALCRCGRSRHKPFCDGMHKVVGFTAESAPQRPRSRAVLDARAHAERGE
jgi:CDGSH-type Zn-finger protein